ncbi:hypothetical protein [Paenibacillus sp. FSL H7-0331]|uniref:DUF7674 family protein n=1 Tax=Paenibacillus sp. FSL H7-0331 TaxID=1920421 RepID=UPI00096FA2B3|nr:hypothetical protein [Paenibacillus sp. FSL H7-0331]OMF08748.1 hypothetical protein BK127_27790 [Paenibacillus sp. FSL H7-0331]
MSTWRRKAIENFSIKFGPMHHDSIYEVFRTLLEMVVEAHKNKDENLLKDIYDYAEWCSDQKAHDLWNAAGVSFYEHLIDSEITLKSIPYWIKPEIFMNIKGLLQWRLKSEEDFRRLVDCYNKVNGTNIEY